MKTVKKKRTLWQILLLLSLLFALSACENGGYVKGEQVNSSISDLEGIYEGRYTSAVGRYTIRFETLSTFPGYEANVEMAVSIESGTMKVSIITPEEKEISEIVTPDNPIHLSGLSIIKTDAQIYYLPIVLEVIGEEEVNGIEYTFSYTAP